MPQSGRAKLQNSLKLFGMPAAAVLAVGLVWIGVQANRTAKDHEAETPPEPVAEAPQSDNLPSEVRLARNDLQGAAGIEIEPVQSRAIENVVSCNGSAAFNQNAYVKVPPKAAGILGKINVDVGVRVQAGDVLAVVKSQPVGEVKDSYLKALIHEEHLRGQIARYKSASEAVPIKILIETEHLLEEELIDTQRYRDRLAEYGFSKKLLDEMVEKKDAKPELPMFAPRSGIVVERAAVEGEPVDPRQVLFAIADLDTLWVNLNAYESSLRYIRVGQDVTFLPDGLPDQEFRGTVTWISPAVDPETRTIQVRAEVANRDGALRANMFGKGELPIGDTSQERLVVPQAAVQSHNGAHVVFVQKPDNLFEARRIVVGLKDDKFWEVTAGLQPGEKVATTGSFLLKSNLENPDFGKIED